MTSIVDKYYRRIIQNIDSIQMKFDISALLGKSKEHDSKINTNVSDIPDNLGKIKTNESNISDNLTTLNNVDNDLISLRDRINTHQTDIQRINTNINAIEQNNLKISDEVFNNRYDIINQPFNFNKNTHSYQLFEKVIENNVTTGELIINTIINYKFDDLENDINRLTHLYEFFDDKNV